MQHVEKLLTFCDINYLLIQLSTRVKLEQTIVMRILCVSIKIQESDVNAILDILKTETEDALVSQQGYWVKFHGSSLLKLYSLKYYITMYMYINII